MLAAVLLGCNSSSSAGVAPGAASKADAKQAVGAPSASARTAPTVPAGPKPPPPPCKAATVVGSVNAVPFVGPGSVPIAALGDLTDDAWIEVGPRSRLSARDAVSTRETSYEGPGLFRVCIAHREESWVRSGTFESVGGAGERPGGEEWVATPLGSLRYDVAKLKMVVADKTLELGVSAGTAYFWPAAGVDKKFFADAGVPPAAMDDEGWIRVFNGTGAKLTVATPVSGEEGASASLDRCAAAAKAAMALTASLDDPDANLADLGPKDIVARRTAHAACGVAYLRIEALPPSPRRDALLNRVRTSEAGWRALVAPREHGVAPALP